MCRYILLVLALLCLSGCSWKWSAAEITSSGSASPPEVNVDSDEEEAVRHVRVRKVREEEPEFVPDPPRVRLDEAEVADYMLSQGRGHQIVIPQSQATPRVVEVSTISNSAPSSMVVDCPMHETNRARLSLEQRMACLEESLSALIRHLNKN